VVFLRATGNLSTGGTAVDVTEEVHLENRALAVRAARVAGLDVAGIDLICDDVSRPWTVAAAGICEVNAAPGLRMHMAPSEGTSRDVAGAIVDLLVPPPGDATIPIAAITGTNGKTTTARMVAHLLSSPGTRVGLATTDGIYIDGLPACRGDMTGPVSARMVLDDPTVDVAVLETARGGLLRAGMAFRRCAVGAVLNVSRDHLGLGGVETLEDLAEVKRIVVEVAKDTAVLNADDPLCLGMRAHVGARRICLVSMRHDNPEVERHLANGGLAVMMMPEGTERMIVLAEEERRITILSPTEIPATLQGRAAFNTQNALFAVAIAHAMGATVQQLRDGLRSFDTTFARAPGRFNICDAHPFRVVLDYGHNPAAVEAVGRAAADMAPLARRICVLAAPGDRRDEDIRAVGRMAARYFHQFVCRHDVPLRGRGPLEVPMLLRDGLVEAGITPDAIAIVPDEIPAIHAAMRQARRGDLVVVFGDAIDEAWRTIVEFEPSGAVPAVPEPAIFRTAPRHRLLLAPRG
jgi:cyanophycin synthetase